MADIVAKVGDTLQVRNYRIQRACRLNQSCVTDRFLESKLLHGASKIVLQQYLPTADVANLLDNLVGVSDKRWRHVEAERLSGPQVDHQLVFGRLLDRQLCRFRALEDAIHIGCSARM